MPLPPRALEAANAIIARVPGTTWTPQDRDLAAALIGRHTGQEKAIEVCKMLRRAFGGVDAHEPHKMIDMTKVDLAHKMACVALRS